MAPYRRRFLDCAGKECLHGRVRFEGCVIAGELKTGTSSQMNAFQKAAVQSPRYIWIWER
jgi:hypothetical protein